MKNRVSGNVLGVSCHRKAFAKTFREGVDEAIQWRCTDSRRWCTRFRIRRPDSFYIYVSTLATLLTGTEISMAWYGRWNRWATTFSGFSMCNDRSTFTRAVPSVWRRRRTVLRVELDPAYPEVISFTTWTNDVNKRMAIGSCRRRLFIKLWTLSFEEMSATFSLVVVCVKRWIREVMDKKNDRKYLDFLKLLSFARCRFCGREVHVYCCNMIDHCHILRSPTIVTMRPYKRCNTRLMISHAQRLFIHTLYVAHHRWTRISPRVTSITWKQGWCHSLYYQPSVSKLV